MAFGGLLETLGQSIGYNDGFDGTIWLTHRAYRVTVGCARDRGGADDPVACTVSVFHGKVVNNDFREYGGAPEQIAMLTLSEIKALPQVTLAALIDAAKTKLGLS
jgi:hypothetical protein